LCGVTEKDSKIPPFFGVKGRPPRCEGFAPNYKGRAIGAPLAHM
jgi:hypothetical protein